MKKSTISFLIALNLCSINLIDVNAETKDMQIIEEPMQNQIQEKDKEQVITTEKNVNEDQNKEQNQPEIQEQNKQSVEIKENQIQNGSYSSDVKENCKILIKQFYKGFYGREADNDGLEYWSNEIVSQRRTVANVFECFINSDECKSKNYNNEEYVKALYIGLQGREPDAAGLEYWTSQLGLGQSRKVVLYNIFNSNEFQTKLDLMGIKNKGQIDLDLNDNKGSVKNLINQFYKGIYGREADNGGLEFWSSQVLDGKQSIADILLVFTNSEECKSKNYTNEEYVKSIYTALFNRTPNNEELNYWVGVLESGNSRVSVLAINMNSKEFQENLDNIGIKNKGTIDTSLDDRKGEVKGIVENFYLGFHGRKADPSGANFWADQIISGNRSVAQVVDSFINSDEFKNKGYSSEEYVKAVYKGILGREADIGGLNFWLNQIVNGGSKKYVLKCIFNSPEFQDKVKSIGIKNIGDIELSSNEVQSTVGKARIKVSALNLRKEPSLEADVLTTMQSGDRVVILGRVKTDLTYYQIEYVKNGKIYNGYASMFVSGVNTTEIFEDNLNNEFLGVLSERYESNGDPGLVSSGNGDYGGKSYGAWQFSSTMGSLDEFVSWLRNENNEFYKKLTDARALDDNTNCGPNFDKAWKEIAQNHNNTFYNLQHKYVKENFYDKLVNKLLKSGDFSNVVSTFAGRNVLWSTAVQHGVTGSYRIISPLQSKCNNVEDFIKAVYAERGRKDENGQLVYFANNSQAVQDSVAKRFIREQEDAIQCYRYSLENK
ncbi:DUF4214 domain-containing protein [Paraclostridium bifermentans]|uniref:DUF4214 domain-containing protein n=1 Tax=Paraclostridium TaxID=1849822 RepID=UPI001CC64F94|nr:MULTISPECIES: DUF4214 domain-containing protein [Paraclostridium]MBZ6006496.1 DUF4214 domain-containing protein [Paraclostridium bifermentans]MDU0298687.1 DUF4214 domain-containing protein [Paraclostridium sp. MRS3W1]